MVRMKKKRAGSEIVLNSVANTFNSHGNGIRKKIEFAQKWNSQESGIFLMKSKRMENIFTWKAWRSH